MTKRADWDWLQAEVDSALRAYVDQLDGLTGSEPVPNLDWSVAELTAHLASLRQVYRLQHEIGPAFVAPPDWAAWSIEQRSHIATDGLGQVTQHLVDETTALLDEYPPDTERWLYGQTTTHRYVAGAILVELVIHGQDLAQITGAKPKLTREQAMAGIPNMMAISPSFVDPAKAAKLAGTYHMRFWSLGDWTYVIDEAGALTVSEGRPRRAAARLWIEPSVFVRTSLGRMNPLRPALTGEAIAHGWKPWRMLSLGKVAVDGV